MVIKRKKLISHLSLCEGGNEQSGSIKPENKGKGKDKIHPRTGHKGPEGE